MSFIFDPRYITNKPIFFIVIGVLLLIMVITLILVIKEIKKNGNK
jgi:hypothetical protein